VAPRKFGEGCVDSFAFVSRLVNLPEDNTVALHDALREMGEVLAIAANRLARAPVLALFSLYRICTT
jgi:hypothetical protein